MQRLSARCFIRPSRHAYHKHQLLFTHSTYFLAHSTLSHLSEWAVIFCHVVTFAITMTITGERQSLVIASQPTPPVFLVACANTYLPVVLTCTLIEPSASLCHKHLPFRVLYKLIDMTKLKLFEQMFEAGRNHSDQHQQHHLFSPSTNLPKPKQWSVAHELAVRARQS